MSNIKQVNEYQNKWHAFIGIALLSFGCYLDYTAVNMALPAIQQDIKANLVSMQWVMNIYFLALCSSATIMGGLGDLYGRRRFLYLGGGIFLIASIIAGCSFNIAWLILGRLLQGIGAAIIFPLSLSLIPQFFPEGERGKVVAWFGSIGGIALALGPLLGGLIVAYLGWPWIFFINIPIGILGYLFCFKSITESHNAVENASLDIKGMLSLTLTMGGLTLGLICSQILGWTRAVTLTSFVVAMCSGLLLVKVEKNHPNPLINFKDYTKPLFVAGTLLCFLAGVLSAVTLFFDPIYLQIIKEQSAQLSGLVLFVIPLSVFLMAFFVGTLINRLGLLHTILFGLALACYATLSQIFYTPNSSLVYIVLSFLCLGCMWAMGNTVSVIAVQTAVEPERASAVTGSLVTLFNIGGSIGLTLAIVLYNLFTHALLYSTEKSQVLTHNQLSTLKDFISSPGQSLQSIKEDLIHQLFKEMFMKGFISTMVLLFLSSCLVFFIVWSCKNLGSSVKKNKEGIHLDEIKTPL